MWRVYLINLPADERRFANSAAQFESRGIPFCSVAAVDGRALSDDEVAEVYDADANRRKARLPLTRPEIGCYLSHIKVWRQIADSDDDGAFVFEDDFCAADDLKDVLIRLSNNSSSRDDSSRRAIARAMTAESGGGDSSSDHSSLTKVESASGDGAGDSSADPSSLSEVELVSSGGGDGGDGGGVFTRVTAFVSARAIGCQVIRKPSPRRSNPRYAGGDWDIVKLFTLKANPRCVWRGGLGGGRDLVVPYRVPNCTVAYGIRRETARRLAATVVPFARAVDNDQKFFWEHDLRIALVLPAPVTAGDQHSAAGAIGDARRHAARRQPLAQKILQPARNLIYQLRYTAQLRRHRRQRRESNCRA